MSDVTTCRTCGLPRFHGPAGYAGAQCLCQWKGATLPQMYDELMAKNAALEAENARLLAEIEELDALRKRQSELLSASAIAIRGPEPALIRYSHADIPERVKMVVADRDAARAQLAAIQGGMGEDVVVLATVSMGGVEYGIGGAELGDIDIQPDMKALCALQQSLVTGEDDAYVELIDKAQHQRITAAMAAEVERLSRMLNNATNDGINLADERDALRAELETLRKDASAEMFLTLTAELAKLRAELAEVKGREAVPVAIANKGDCAFWVSWTEAGKPLRGPGIKLYTTPPASPDVEGLAKALEDCAGRLRLLIDSGRHKMLDAVAEEKARTALSTWRQAQEGKP